MPHLEEHISKAHWPSACPHPLCDVQMQDEMSFWYHLSDAHNLRRDNIKGRKRGWKAVTFENNDDMLLEAREQSGTSHGIEKKQKSTRLKEMVEIEVIKYSPPHSSKLSPTSANGNSPRRKQDHIPREQLAIFTHPNISPTLTLLSSAIQCPTTPDLTYTGTSSPGSAMSCPTENCASTRGDYDGGDSPSRLDFLGVNHDMNGLNEESQWTELPVNSKGFTGITVVDLTEDKPLTYNDLLSRYTTIPASTGSCIKGASDDDGNMGMSDFVSGKPCLPSEIETPPANTTDCNPAEPIENVQIKPRKSGIKLRLNPPKDPKPRILLRVKQPEQASSQEHRCSVGRNERRVRKLAPTAKKPRRKRRTQN